MAIAIDNLTPISPVVTRTAAAGRTSAHRARESARSPELPPGVQSIGEILPFVLAEMGIAESAVGGAVR